MYVYYIWLSNREYTDRICLLSFVFCVFSQLPNVHNTGYSIIHNSLHFFFILNPPLNL